ncbi:MULTISPECIES: BN159_2729 family protein [unclassified Streptomyces]|uniref:BN159_2729 family protein n=1 Tax=unclassified Streptomyces TaxID=2593676 RepID=UPI00190C934C|nr:MULTISPECIES: BN159_2729 family protein [unclassified Streptomyces]MBK3563183.1 BN159_2729 family protein [Streptomyces sp. MBT62]MBK6013172.1 BN159_2729 family protein [Streptomyces sp. MBT53]
MNKNLPHAVRVIRAALASTGSDPAAAIAHALDGVQLLVDPERSFGQVLRRTPAGGWAREHQEQQELPERTELEQQALAWDESCGRARRVAAVIRRHIGEHPAFQNIQVDGDRILVALHIVDQTQWVQWRPYFGITHDKETALPYMVAGDGYRDGVRVSVVAYDLPQARAHALKIAKEPYELDGVVYDLALPQRDARGDVWFYQGVRTANGMPLLSIDGRPERCTLASIVRQAGPLTAVTDTPSQQATPVMTGGQA